MNCRPARRWRVALAAMPARFDAADLARAAGTPKKLAADWLTHQTYRHHPVVSRVGRGTYTLIPTKDTP